MDADQIEQYFTHERGTYMSFYALALIGGSSIGPIIAGFISDGIGFQWVFFIPTIFCGVVCVIMFFFMEETNYTRKTSEFVQDAEIHRAAQEHNVSVPSGISDQDDTKQTSEGTSAAPVASAVESVEYRRKTFFQKMALFDTHSRSNNFWTLFQNQVRFCTWPVVLASGFWYGLNLVWTVVFGFTSSTILSAPPYNFS